MTVAIIGLGLIGGSLAKAYKAAGHRVLASDTDQSILNAAICAAVVDAPLDDSSLQSCELILLAVYPQAAIEFIESAQLSPHTMVIDCCGTKRSVCAIGFEAAQQRGFTFVGGHPMAGTEQSGFAHSKADMFNGASMIIVPPPAGTDEALLARVEQLLAPAQFGRMTVTTAEKHDAMIAFTSQMAHLVSNAFIKSPTLREHKGFSAGSYKDLTRVAWLNEHMWTELFLENRENLLYELDLFILSLQAYHKALETEDSELLRMLLLEGKRLKEEVDRR
ncbi:MAG: prephenate dehydrogenase [Deferribacteraceae bacterium]|jgi:prephenate dehydrogenase|nr:prephenate dehydrogenase [Deferribacteraceae bacterium]